MEGRQRLGYGGRLRCYVRRPWGRLSGQGPLSCACGTPLTRESRLGPVPPTADSGCRMPDCEMLVTVPGDALRCPGCGTKQTAALPSLGAARRGDVVAETENSRPAGHFSLDWTGSIHGRMDYNNWQCVPSRHLYRVRENWKKKSIKKLKLKKRRVHGSCPSRWSDPRAP